MAEIGKDRMDSICNMQPTIDDGVKKCGGAERIRFWHATTVNKGINET